MSIVYHNLASGNFSQDWSNTGLITTNDDWSGVPSIMGYRGDNLSALAGTDPQTVLGSGTPVIDVNANQANPSTYTTGGVTEFQITDPVIALSGSGTADAPNLVIYLDATGRENITVSYRLRDIDGAADNSVQPIALQYRIGNTGDFVNVPAAYFADASTGPSLTDDNVANISVTLPSAVNNAAQLEVRIITNDASGSDEWIGIDDIQVTSQAMPAGPTLTYTGQLNESKVFDGSINDKIIIKLSGGDTFADLGADMLSAGQASVTNAPAGLTAVLTRIDNTTAELTLTGSATSHASADDVGNLTVTFTDGAFTGGSAAAVTNATKNDLSINFGDPGAAGSTQTFTPNAGTTQDSSDASTAIALNANWMVVGDDEANVLRVYSREGGAAVKEWSYASDLGLGSNELDLEAGTRIGDTLYFIGSHSNSSGGSEDNNREHVFAVTVSGSGADTTFTYVNQYAGLESDLAAWDSNNTHGLGANYFGLTASSAGGVAPEAASGFSIEGMTANQAGNALLLALRAPQSSTTSRDKAVIVSVDLANLFTTPSFGAPVELDLDGRGIRSIEKAADGNGYLVLAGPAGAASVEATQDFRLYRLDNALTTATEIDVDLDALLVATGGSFETIVDVLNTAQGTLVQLLQDNGDTIWPGKSQASKSLPAAEQQFQGNWIALGADAGADATGPTLASSTPADDASDVSVGANIVLKFSEAVKAGTGNFVIKKTSDDSVVATIAASDAQVSYAFNTVTINPTTDLANATGYYIEADATAITDINDNTWAGISGASNLNFTTAAAAPAYALLITEVNSNAGPADFFELYNYGGSTIDLSNWRWTDSAAAFGAATATFAPGTTLAAGQKLVVIQKSLSTDIDAFRTAWNLPTDIAIVAVGGPGLGSGDAVVVFDASGNTAAGFNYTTAAITASDGTIINPVVRSDSNPAAGGHAGASVGGAATESAVWDGQSTSAPKYDNATVNTLGAYAQGGAPANIGSPGRIDSGYDLTLGAYTESFAVNLGEFTTYSIDADSAHTWYRATSGYAEVNGYGDTAAANDWLISKSFDLSKTAVEYLSFTTWTRYSDTGITNPEVKLYYSINYSGSGDPTAATWTELSYTPSADNSQVTTPSGLIDLSAINGANVYFAFQYTSSGTGSNSSSNWRVDDISLTGYNGAVLSIAATDASKTEGNAATTAFTFTVTRAGDTSGATDVNWAVTGSSASPADAADFGGTLPSGVVSFGVGETTKTITVDVSGETTAESTEGFTVTLSGATGGASIIQATATGSILDDDSAATRISAIQGNSSASAMDGNIVTVEAVVTAYMPGLGGFYIQEEASDVDADPTTSEGIFVYDNRAVTIGDIVRFNAEVDEFKGLTELKNLSNFSVVSSGNPLPTATLITLPVADMVNWEAVEGMLVEVRSSGSSLVITDNYNLGQYGQVTLTSDSLLRNYTEDNAPSIPGYTAYQASTQRDQIILDDAFSSQFPSVHPGRGGNDLSASNTLRAGDSVTSITGVLDQYVAGSELAYETTYRIQPTVEPVFSGAARPTASDLQTAVGSPEIKVASANVLNYFTTFGTANFTNPNGTTHDGRGASNATEFAHQQAKIVENLIGMNADVYGLMEMQNNGFDDGSSAIDNLVDAMNAVAGAGTYAYISGPFNDGAAAGDSLTAGDDAIMVAIIYKTTTVVPVGQAAVPDVTAYDAFSATYGNRVPLAQTFKSLADNEQFTLVVNHLKSKGSVIDADVGDGQGNNNQARMEGVRDLLAWLGTNPTGSSDPDYLLVGDFNAYSHEDPIAYLDNNGYDKVSSGLSYSFDGLWGSLDHALTSTSMTSQVGNVVKWDINAPEPAILDYNMENKDAAQDVNYYAADPYRSSDHNPILIGLNLSGTVADTTAPLFQSASVDGSTLTLTYSEAINATNKAPASAFSVNIGGTSVTPTSVAVSGSTITLTLPSAVTSGQSVLISYTDPTAGNDVNATQDTIGNDAVSLVDQIVTNLTAAPAPTPTPTPEPTPTPTPSVDGDNIPGSTENLAPALGAGGTPGDGNGDGILDSAQSQVSSFTVINTTPGSTGSTFMTLVADSLAGKVDLGDGNSATITNISQLDSPANKPAGLTLPTGLISFSADIGTAGSSETFSFYVDANLDINGFWIQGSNGVWYNVANEAHGGNLIQEGNKLRLDFKLTDGGPFDADGKADGNITCIGGLGEMPLSIIGLPSSDVPAGTSWF
ncbi:MAG: ExeM/NucH family extracellular endonuclease [Pseudomonadota bacterium]